MGRAPGETGPSASAPAQGTHLQVRLEAVPGGTVKGLRGAGWSLIGHSLVVAFKCPIAVVICAHTCVFAQLLAVTCSNGPIAVVSKFTVM